MEAKLEDAAVVEHHGGLETHLPQPAAIQLVVDGDCCHAVQWGFVIHKVAEHLNFSIRLGRLCVRSRSNISQAPKQRNGKARQVARQMDLQLILVQVGCFHGVMVGGS